MEDVKIVKIDFDVERFIKDIESKEPIEQEKDILFRWHDLQKDAIEKGYDKEQQCPVWLDYSWKKLNQGESKMLNKATGKPMKNGELWERNENYREKMIAELKELENKETAIPLKMFYRYLIEELFIPCRKDRLDMTVSHDLYRARNDFIAAAKIGYEKIADITERIYNEEVLERTENLTEFI